ncbi:hypothetical protein ABTQ06_19575, partial [Acinetobacter baumannii]
DELQPVAEVLDAAHVTSAYTQALARQRDKLRDPARTGSARVLEAMSAAGHGFYGFAQERADRIRDEMLARPLPADRERELS